MTNPPAAHEPAADAAAADRAAEPLDETAHAPAPAADPAEGDEATSTVTTADLDEHRVPDDGTPRYESELAADPTKPYEWPAEEPAAEPAAEPTTEEPAAAAPPPPPPGAMPPPPPGGMPPPFGNFGGPKFNRAMLVRPLQGRFVAGVCAAIGRATNTDPTLWRVLFAVLTLAGGVSIVAYLLAWLLLPAEGDTGSPLEALLGRGRSATSAPLAIVVGVCAVLVFLLVMSQNLAAAAVGLAIVVGVMTLLARQSGGNTGGPFATAGGPGEVPGPSGGPGMPGGPAGGGFAGPPPGPFVPPPAAPAGPSFGTGAFGPSAFGPSAFAGPAPAAYAPMTAPTTPAPPTSGAGPAATATQESPTLSTPRVTSAPPPVAPMPPTAPPPPIAPLPPLPPFGSVGAGYRPPFAPRGPYATTSPYAASLGYPPGPPGMPISPYPGLAPTPPKPPKERSKLGRITFSLMLLALGVLVAIDVATPISFKPSTFFAVPLAVTALGLIVGAWLGRARVLILMGALLSIALAIATAAGTATVPTDARNWNLSPQSVNDLSDRYSTDFGNINADLTAIDFVDQDVATQFRVGAGAIDVYLPENVDVVVDVHIQGGDCEVLNRDCSGINQTTTYTDNGSDGPGGGKLHITVDMNWGNVRVTR